MPRSESRHTSSELDDLDKEYNPIYLAIFIRATVETTMTSLQVRIADLENRILSWRTDYTFRRFMRALKAGFNPEQPRNEWGRWTSGGGVSVTKSSGFYTGIQSIDETSDALSDILTNVIEKLEYLPSMSPQVYGMLVHVAFGLEVRLKGLQGVGDIERTFSLEDSDPYYGFAGSVRTDVTLRNIQGDIVAIYDVKTGNARMSQKRADRLREKTGAASGTPVFELNVTRGVFRKSYSLLWRFVR